MPFLDAYAQGNDIMHWRLSAYNTHRIGIVLDGLLPGTQFHRPTELPAAVQNVHHTG